MLTSYQDQNTIVSNDISPPILQPIPYLPAGQLFLENNIHYLNLAMLTVICPHCHALYFDCEKLTSLRVNHPKFGMCCLQGQIQLPPLQLLTGILHNYLTGNDYLSREFCNNIHQYNVAFAMTSVEVKINNSVTGCQERAEQEQSDLEQGRVTPEQKRIDNKSRNNLGLSSCTMP